MHDEPTRSMSEGSDPDQGPDHRRATDPSTGPPPPRAAPGAPVPTRIGRYTILRILGEGGMGTVYEAEQENPKRTVALKVIRAGYLSAELLRRFGQESQVLGRLQHPGIAQVYEAGMATGSGGTVLQSGGWSAGTTALESSATRMVPFFAMEFIRGVPLTDYAQQKNLGTRERLDLVARICDAVYHAHQKGVIHRDLKPGNILVDESGQPKILDFGVARATDSDIQQTTIQTDIGQLIGTVPYMSPEQVSGNPDDLDTRSDVYALGVIAYELLAGRLPYDLRRKMIHEAARIIKEEEPTRLSSINRSLRGDVETIVAKALEKDKSRRYQSAEALASDIRRHLKDEPITARPASTWYQAAKFARRNKGLVAGLAAAFAFLVGGLVFSLSSRHQALAARDSETNQRRLAEGINEFMQSALISSDPNQGGKEGMLVADAMTQAVARLDEGAFRGQPEVEAGLRLTIATILDGNAKSENALAVAQRALEINRQLHAGDHPTVSQSLNRVGACLISLGRFAEALPPLSSALEMDQRLNPGDDPDVAVTLGNVAVCLDNLGRAGEALPKYQAALEMDQRLYQGDHPDIAVDLINLGACLESLGRSGDALPQFEAALQLRRRLFKDDHPALVSSLNSLAFCLKNLGRPGEALPVFQSALDMTRRMFHSDHPNTAQSLNNLAVCLQALDRSAEALTQFQAALEMMQRMFPGGHPYTAFCLNNAAFCLDSLGRSQEAVPMFERALEVDRGLYPGDHPEIAVHLRNLARCLARLGRLDEALERARQGAEMAGRTMPESHNTRLRCEETLAEIQSQVEAAKAGEAAPAGRK